MAAVFVFSQMEGRAGEAVPSAQELCREWFGSSTLVAPLATSDTNSVVQQVTSDGQTIGWIFRTDQVPPVCQGKRGEIAVLVGLGTEGRIKGLRVLSHKEDTRYFNRLKPSFFRQFLNLRADAGTHGIDAVTHATFSSHAIIQDVMEGARHVISLPEVAAQRKHSEDCALTKTAAVLHN